MQLKGEIYKDTSCSIQYALEWKMALDSHDRTIIVLICNFLTSRSEGTQNRIITKVDLGDLDSQMTTRTGSTGCSDAMSVRKKSISPFNTPG